MELIDLTDKTFGKLYVVQREENTPSGGSRWLCRCECGRERTVDGSLLRGNQTISCGCYRRKPPRNPDVISKRRSYRAWAAMVARCTNPNHPNQEWYLERGIAVEDDRWLVYENFYADMGECPPGLTLERRKNELGYFKDNCVWDTQKVQCNNRRSNRLLEFNGRTQSLTMWAEEYGLKPSTFRQRLFVFGWSMEKSLTTPVKVYKRTLAAC